MDWIKEYWLSFIIYFFLVNLAAFTLTFVIVVNLPEDYLVRDYTPKTHPILAMVRNFSGLLFVTVGVFMLFLPGPGLLTIFCGLVVMHSSQKQKILLKIVKRKKVEVQIQRIREKFGKSKLDLPALDHQ